MPKKKKETKKDFFGSSIAMLMRKDRPKAKNFLKRVASSIKKTSKKKGKKKRY